MEGAAGTSGQVGAAGDTAGAGPGGMSGPGTAGLGDSGLSGDGAAGAGGSAGDAGAAGAGGSTGTAGVSGAGGIGEDIPPWRPLGITVSPGLHTHTTPSGLTAGLDNRAAKMAGKVVLDIGVVSGGYEAYLGKRGFHVIGVKDVNDCTVNDWSQGRDFDGDCRFNNLDGLPHGTQKTVTTEQAIMNQVFQTLTTFEKSYPGEGWGYFLTQDGKGVRWSDTIFTGISHGAQDAACFAHELRVSAAVSSSGPRDNTCGKGAVPGNYDPNNPPWFPLAATCDATHCCVDHIASWIDSPSATPIDRYYGFVGEADTQYGDIMFTMERMHFVGAPVNVTQVAAPYNGSHRFYANVGHGALSEFPIAAVNVAFGVLPENSNPTF
jgi:hypothetical protein